MVPNDFCRLCKLNMREDGPSTYGHSTDMFLTKKTTSISDKLALLGLIVSQESGKSNRCCSRCSSVVSRLERDLPVFRQWEEEFYDGNESIRQGESGPSKMPTALITSCPDTTSQRASASGQTTTQVTIIYPSQTLTRVCGPEEDPIVKFIVLRRWKEAATHALKHQDLQEKLKEGVIKLICKECEVLCSRKNDFMLWKSKPEDLKSFSFNSLRDDLHRLAPFLLSIFNCISNDNKLAACTAAAVAIRGREPRLAALSYWINTILQFGRAKKSVFNRLSQLSLTTSHNKAVKKRHELALCCGAEFVQLKGGLKATETEEPQNLEDVRQSGCQTLFPSPSLNVNQDIPETSQIKEEPEEQCIKQEEEQLQEPVVEPKVECVKIEPSMFQQTEDSMEIKEEDINADSSEPGNYEPMVECVKIEPSMFQQTEDSKEIKGEDINADSSEPGNHDDWRSSLSCADVEMEADGEDFHKDQITAESMTAHNTSQSSNFQSAAETSAAVNPGDLCTEARGEGKKRYQCVFCPKSFSRILLLQNHITTHTGDKPFSCPSCDKTFTFRADLEGHIRMHTGEKPFSCSHCDKLFAQQRSLTQHLKTHTSDKPYNCPLCSKTFSLKGNLTLHMRKHTGEKPFSCAVCEEAFYCKSNLEEHSRSHTEKL
ncbi:unnamed protein product [Knipowitschia caucasica]